MHSATNFKFGRDIHRVYPNKSPLKICEKRERGRIQGLSKFLEYSLLSQDPVKLRSHTNFKFGSYIHRIHPNKKPIKNWEKMSVGLSSDCLNFFSTPIISGTGKVTNFQFCMHILSIDRNKSPLQISGKVAVGVVRTLEIFQGTHTLGASRGRLCGSSAFLLLFDSRLVSSFNSCSVYDSEPRRPFNVLSN